MKIFANPDVLCAPCPTQVLHIIGCLADSTALVLANMHHPLPVGRQGILPALLPAPPPAHLPRWPVPAGNAAGATTTSAGTVTVAAGTAASLVGGSATATAAGASAAAAGTAAAGHTAASAGASSSSNSNINLMRSSAGNAASTLPAATRQFVRAVKAHSGHLETPIARVEERQLAQARRYDDLADQEQQRRQGLAAAGKLPAEAVRMDAEARLAYGTHVEFLQQLQQYALMQQMLFGGRAVGGAAIVGKEEEESEEDEELESDGSGE